VFTYDQTMRHGAQLYSAALRALRDAGITAAFIQTGGMNAALEAVLDGGAVLLVTDAEECLSWDRSEQQGWGAGVYRDQERQEPLAFGRTPGTSTAELLGLVRLVLADAGRAARRSERP